MNRPRIRQVLTYLAVAALGMGIGTLILSGLQEVYEILRASPLTPGQ